MSVPHNQEPKAKHQLKLLEKTRFVFPIYKSNVKINDMYFLSKHQNLYITKFSAFQKIHPSFQIISKNSADCYAHKENIHQNFTALKKSTEKSAEFFTDLCDH